MLQNNITISIEEFYQSNDIDESFDEQAYQEKHPETLAFYQPYCQQNNIDNKHRLYYHYSIYNTYIDNNSIDSNEEIEQNKWRIDQDMLEEFVDKSNIRNINTKLEAICLLMTGNEISEGTYDHFVKQVLNTINNSKTCAEVASKINFYIITNKKHTKLQDIDHIDRLFKTCNIIYLDEDNEHDQKHRYGSKYGPNISFFQTFQKFKHYNTTLFLECDVYLCDNWLTKIFNYVDHNQFLIAGSTSGEIFLDPNLNLNSIIYGHINGGVCLYATGHDLLQQFIDFAYIYMPIYIEQIKDYNIAYDIYISYLSALLWWTSRDISL